VTASTHTALRDIKLDSLDVIHAGKETFRLTPEIRAVGLSRIWSDIVAR